MYKYNIQIDGTGFKHKLRLSPAVADLGGMKWLGLAIGLLLVIAFAAQLPGGRIAAGQNDFLQFYGGAKLAGTGQLHSIEAMKELQLREAGIYLPAVQYVRPDYYAVLLKPLGWLPFRTAYWLFQALNLAALGGLLWMYRDAVWLRWLVPVSIPLVISFANGQDVPLLLFLLGAAVKRKGLAGGALLALCTIKLHFLVLVPLVLIFWRRWQTIAGGVVTMVGLVGIGAWSEGWDWVLRYPGYLRRPEIHPDQLQFLNLRGIVKAAALSDATLLYVAVALAFVGMLWVLRNRSIEVGFAAALLGGMLLSYHLGVHDCSLLLLVLALAPRGSTLERGVIVLATPVPYYLLMLDGWVGAIPALALVGVVAASIAEYVKNRRDSEINSSLAYQSR